MAILGIGALLVILFLLGIVVAIIAAIGMAIAHGRLGLAVAIGSGVFLMVIILLSFVATATVQVYQPHATVTATTNTALESTSGPHFTVNGFPQPAVSFGSQPRWRIGVFPALFLVIAIMFILARSAKHHFAHAGAAGHAFRWPVLIAIPIVAILVIGGFRSQVKHDENAISQADEINENVRVQAEAFAQQQQAFANRAAETNTDINEQIRAQTEAFVKQQQALVKRAAELSNDLHQRIDKMDIQQLMDEFDAPRIMLQMPLSPSSAPAALIMAATPKTLGPVGTATNTTVANTTDENKEHSPSKSKSHGAKAPSAMTVASLNQTPTIPESPAPPSPAAAAVPPAAPAPQAAASAASGPSSGSTEAAAELQREHIAAVGATQHHSESTSSGKPAWINKPPKRTGNVRREVIETEDFETADECYQAADVYLLFKTYDHIQQLANQPVQDTDLPSITFQKGMILANGTPIAIGDKNRQWVDWRPQYLNALGISLDYIRRELVAKDPTNNESCEFLDTVDRSVGPMKKLYMELEFTPAVDRDLTQKLDAYARRGRFKMVGVSSVFIFGLLFTVWGLLRVDTATKGYYSKWLFVGVPAAIIGVLVLSFLAYMNTGGL